NIPPLQASRDDRLDRLGLLVRAQRGHIAFALDVLCPWEEHRGNHYNEQPGRDIEGESPVRPRVERPERCELARPDKLIDAVGRDGDHDRGGVEDESAFSRMMLVAFSVQPGPSGTTTTVHGLAGSMM